MINTLVADLIEQSAKNIEDAAPASLSMVREAPALIGFSKKIHQEQQELKKFLRDHLYRHYQVARMSAKARHTIEMLFKAFHSDTSGCFRPHFNRNLLRMGIRRLPTILRA